MSRDLTFTETWRKKKVQKQGQRSKAIPRTVFACSKIYKRRTSRLPHNKAPIHVRSCPQRRGQARSPSKDDRSPRLLAPLRGHSPHDSTAPPGRLPRDGARGRPGRQRPRGAGGAAITRRARPPRGEPARPLPGPGAAPATA